MYQVVVPKALAPKELVQVYEAGELVVLPAWDPMVRYTSYPFLLVFLLTFFLSNFKGALA